MEQVKECISRHNIMSNLGVSSQKEKVSSDYITCSGSRDVYAECHHICSYFQMIVGKKCTQAFICVYTHVHIPIDTDQEKRADFIKN